MKILVINCGSSSVKYALFENEKEIIRGTVDRIGISRGPKNHSIAIRKVIKELERVTDIKEIAAVGHRVVHGGEISKSCIITSAVLRDIEKNSKFAPLHNPYNLKGILTIKKLISHAKNIAVFDTAFHTTIPVVANMYAIPLSWSKKYKIKKYGFHGISHKYVSLEAISKLNLSKKKNKIITCHLGNGCSITAIKDGCSVDTTMGFTPLEGLVMGTRSGDIDPAIVGYLQKKEKISASTVIELLNKKSGLLGLCGLRDFRDILKRKNKNKKAQLAYDIFIYRIRKYIGAYILLLGGADAIVFTGGIGENSKQVVRDCVSDLDALLKKNPVILQIKTDEEKMIAKEVLNLI